MRGSFIYETTLSPHDKSGKHVGDIDVRITYAVSSYGAPARIHFTENDHPAEFAEIDVIHVEMLNAPKSGREATYIDAWDWLYDWAIDWCNEFASELAGAARLDTDRREEDASERYLNVSKGGEYA